MPTLARILISLCVGAAAILAWQSYGDAVRKIIAGTYPQLGWLVPGTARIVYSAPDAIGLAAQAAPSPDQRVNAISLDLDAMRQNVDRIAINQEQMTHNVDKLTAGQERMTHNVDQLAAGQERMTREISKLQMVEQQSKPPQRPDPARRPVPRSSQASKVR